MLCLNYGRCHPRLLIYLLIKSLQNCSHILYLNKMGAFQLTGLVEVTSQYFFTMLFFLPFESCEKKSVEWVKSSRWNYQACVMDKVPVSQTFRLWVWPPTRVTIMILHTTPVLVLIKFGRTHFLRTVITK